MKRDVRPILAATAVVLLGAACSGDGIEGTYTHDEEGTITLSEGGNGTWVHPSNLGPFEFEWKEEGDSIVISTGGVKEDALRLEDGDLVQDGEKETVFERQ